MKIDENAHERFIQLLLYHFERSFIGETPAILTGESDALEKQRETCVSQSRAD